MSRRPQPRTYYRKPAGTPEPGQTDNRPEPPDCDALAWSLVDRGLASKRILEQTNNGDRVPPWVWRRRARQALATT